MEQRAVYVARRLHTSCLSELNLWNPPKGVQKVTH